MEKNWAGLPYRPISEFYKQRFGEKVFKIPVTIAETCPNRMGLRGMETCAFCDVWGSAADSDSQNWPLKTQIENTKIKIAKKYNAKKFLVYFQAYTTTFKKIKALEESFNIALEDPDVVGIVVGTRPDCLSTSLIQLWQKYHEQAFVSVELGVQSFNDDTLKFYRRGHLVEKSFDAIKKIKSESNVDLGIHLILGNPIESDEEIKTTAEVVNDLKIQHVKLHHLHILKNTTFEKEFKDGKFHLPTFEEYARRVGIFLSNLSPEIYIHRLAAYAPRWEELIAPSWTADKMKSHQEIIDYLRESSLYQSKNYVTNNMPEKLKQQRLTQMVTPTTPQFSGI